MRPNARMRLRDERGGLTPAGVPAPRVEVASVPPVAEAPPSDTPAPKKRKRKARAGESDDG